jgi:hypothetical protein
LLKSSPTFLLLAKYGRETPTIISFRCGSATEVAELIVVTDRQDCSGDRDAIETARP